jgi:uncharacterized protein
MFKEDYIKNLDPKAMRWLSPGVVELRKAEGKPAVGRGYAAKFNTLSEDFGGFKERIGQGFFDEALGDDVRALFNHDPNLILGRSTNKTLRMGVDSTGLWYEWDDPGTSYSQDLLKSLERGDIDQSSFAFSIKEDRWDKIDGLWVRTLLKAGRLYDVSPVTYPAYRDTEASKRSFADMLKVTPPDSLAEMEHERRKLELKIKSAA